MGMTGKAKGKRSEVCTKEERDKNSCLYTVRNVENAAKTKKRYMNKVSVA